MIFGYMITNMITHYSVHRIFGGQKNCSWLMLFKMLESTYLMVSVNFLVRKKSIVHYCVSLLDLGYNLLIFRNHFDLYYLLSI